MDTIRRREDLPKLLQTLNLNGAGAEVGVWKGRFSHHLLANSNLSVLYSIDAWDEKFTKDKWSQSDSDDAYEVTKKSLEKFRSRSVIIKETSVRAAQKFEDHFFDFIYLDAGHDYQSVKEDIENWWPKLKKGGIFSGHDYFKRENTTVEEWGVVEAVDDFISREYLKLYVTTEGGKWKSWYCLKTKVTYG